MYQYNFECPVCGCRETYSDECVECGIPLSEFVEVRLTPREPNAAGGVAHESPDAEAAAQVTLNG